MSSKQVARLRISLKYTEPEIWRLVEVPAAMTLKELHAVIQSAMGWDDAHLFEFQVGRERVSAGRVRLADLAAHGVKRFTYVYDMGDGWDHGIKIEKLLPADPATPYPRLIAGALRCPPEDVGGIPGFYAFLDAISDPRHPDHEDRIDWYGGIFDPKDIDLDRIQKDLSRIAARGKRAAAKHAS
jgi:Plasmid pRiA4b ORF-3-like protein